MKHRQLLILIGFFSASTWYIPFLRERIVAYYMVEPYRAYCYLASAVQWGCIILYGLLSHDLIRAYALSILWEYGFLFQVCGNTRYDLYPISDIGVGYPYGNILAIFHVAVATILFYLSKENESCPLRKAISGATSESSSS